jgi:hypothetical protein
MSIIWVLSMAMPAMAELDVWDEKLAAYAAVADEHRRLMGKCGPSGPPCRNAQGRS